METKDPALTKSPISDTDNNSHANPNTMHDHDTADEKGPQTLQETVIGTRYASDDVDHGEHMHEDIHHNDYNVMSTDDEIEENTTINKGTDTFQDSIVNSEHVNDGDNPARQPDRRDQEGSSPFDEGINEDTVGSEEPKSEDITDMNRYASIDNAQTRILTPDEKD